MHDLGSRVERLLEGADARVHDFQSLTGLACPSGCGACCLAPHVEAAPAELAPMAVAAVRAGRAGELLARIEARAGEARCVLYEPSPEDERRGRCGEYALRPLVCRLYGFAGRRDADGRRELLACRVMRASTPELVASAERRALDGELPLPLFSDHAYALAAEVPGSGGNRLPINVALRLALERAQLEYGLRALEGADEPEPDPFRGPELPPRRAA